MSSKGSEELRANKNRNGADLMWNRSEPSSYDLRGRCTDLRRFEWDEQRRARCGMAVRRFAALRCDLERRRNEKKCEDGAMFRLDQEQTGIELIRADREMN